MKHDQAVEFIRNLLMLMSAERSSDLFVTVGFPPAMKVDGKLIPLSKQYLSDDDSGALVRAIMSDVQAKEFSETKECNFAIHPEGLGRFRVSAFVQQGYAGMVIRAVATEIPTFDSLELPEVFKDISMTQRGLVIIVGATGVGKSTTLAAIMNYRNEHTQNHVVTIEDPIEYMHPSKKCIVTQREVGIDTASWEVALRNALRQAPDVILIGEVRDRRTMEYALAFAETGHLCLTTLHANNANQALDRMINFFPEERRAQLLLDLSLNLRAIISQRLISRAGVKGRCAAIEILLNSPLISDKIFQGEVAAIKEIMQKSRQFGMQTFDQALFDLYESDKISYEDALRGADSVNDLRLQIKLHSKKAQSNLASETGTLDLL